MNSQCTRKQLLRNQTDRRGAFTLKAGEKLQCRADEQLHNTAHDSTLVKAFFRYLFSQRLYLSGGHHRLIFPQSAELVYQQQHGGGALRGLPGRRLMAARHT